MMENRKASKARFLRLHCSNAHSSFIHSASLLASTRPALRGDDSCQAVLRRGRLLERRILDHSSHLIALMTGHNNPKQGAVDSQEGMVMSGSRYQSWVLKMYSSPCGRMPKPHVQKIYCRHASGNCFSWCSPSFASIVQLLFWVFINMPRGPANTQRTPSLEFAHSGEVVPALQKRHL